MIYVYLVRMNKAFRSIRLVLSVTAVMLTLPGMLMAGSHPDDLLGAIQKQNDQYVAAYRAKDAAAITALHTKDATVIAPHYSPVKGHAEILAGLEAELSAGDAKLELQALEVTRLGEDTAYEIGQYKQSLALPDGSVIKDEGNTVVIWKLGKDDVWRLHVDMWNSSLPAATGE